MPIVASDILLKLSIKTGSSGNSSAQSDVNQSLGKYISTTQISTGLLNNLFDNISGAENAASTVDYRCLFIHNAHATLTWQAPYVWISAEVSGGANAAIGVDPTAASVIGSSSSQAVAVSDENTAPAGVSFSSPTTKLTGLALGDIGPGQCKAVWVRRSATNSGAMSSDGVSLSIEGDAAA